MVRPGEVGVAPGRDAELPARVVVLAKPVGVVEGRVGEDAVGAEVGMQIAPEGVGDVIEEDESTCLYSAASMLVRSLSAASQSLASKPREPELLEEELLAFARAICEARP